MRTSTATHHSRAAMAVALGVLIALSGCPSSAPGPPDAAISERVAATLPAYVGLKSIQTDRIKEGDISYRVNFKAVLTTKEDLYQSSSTPRFVPDPEPLEDPWKPVPEWLRGNPELVRSVSQHPVWPKYRELDLAQKRGAELTLYGHCDAKRMVDTWQIADPVFDSGMEALGKPRNSFGPGFVVPGSPEAQAAVKDIMERRRKFREALAQTVDRLKRGRAEAIQRLREGLNGKTWVSKDPDRTHTGTFTVNEDGSVVGSLDHAWYKQHGYPNASFHVEGTVTGPGSIRIDKWSVEKGDGTGQTIDEGSAGQISFDENGTVNGEFVNQKKERFKQTFEQRTPDKAGRPKPQTK